MHISRETIGRNSQKTMVLEKTHSYYALCCISASALAAHCVLWESVLAPIRPHHFWLSLKCIPIVWALMCFIKKKIRTFQATTLLIWIYVFEGLSRLFSDTAPYSRVCALIEIILSISVFIFCTNLVRTQRQLTIVSRRQTK